MAKRKRKPGQKPAFRFKPAKNYRTDKYVMYVHNIETSILVASKIKSDIVVDDIQSALRQLVKQLQQPSGYETLFGQKTTGQPSSETLPDFINTLIIKNLNQLFADKPPLNAEDLIGVLRTIQSSVKFWSKKDRIRGYLRFLDDFMAEANTDIYELTEKEIEQMNFDSF